jgi:two-component system cell cycle response regulator CtrA
MMTMPDERDREIDSLRDALEAMRTALTEEPGLKLIKVAGLTYSERLMVGLLVRRGRVRRDQFMTVLYAERPDHEPNDKIVDVLICKIRKKLKPYGVVIKTVWGAGYELTPESREIVKKMIAEAA